MNKFLDSQTRRIAEMIPRLEGQDIEALAGILREAVIYGETMMAEDIVGAVHELSTAGYTMG